MKLSVCQLPNNLSLDHPAWADFVRRLHREQPDIAVLNEMPFGGWIANEARFDARLAASSVDAHESALPVLRRLPIALLGSRPVQGKAKLVNEACTVPFITSIIFRKSPASSRKPGSRRSDPAST